MNTGDRGLEVRGPGAVAHMSLHQKLTMSKSYQHENADSDCSPIFTGGPAIRFMLATNPAERLKTVSAASVRGHIWVTSDSVNAFLQFYFKATQKARKSAKFWRLLCAPDGDVRLECKVVLTIETPEAARFILAQP